GRSAARGPGGSGGRARRGPRRASAPARSSRARRTRRRELLSAARAAGYGGFQLGDREDVAQPLLGGIDLRAAQDRRDLGAREAATALGGAGEEPGRPRERCRVEAELAVARREAGDDPARDEAEDPARVLAGDELPGAAEGVGAHGAPGGERGLK